MEAPSYEAYVEHRTNEADATAQLFSVCASADVRANPSFDEEFMPLLKTLARSACMLDSANDLADDYKEGKTILKPSWTNRIKLLREALTQVLPQLEIVRHKAVRREIGRAALLHAGRHMSDTKLLYRRTR